MGLRLGGRSDALAVDEGDSVSNLDYSGGRKTHRFPPPYGLGSLSLTHRPTENPTGVTKKSPYGKLPIPTFPNQGKEKKSSPSEVDSESRSAVQNDEK